MKGFEGLGGAEDEAGVGMKAGAVAVRGLLALFCLLPNFGPVGG